MDETTKEMLRLRKEGVPTKEIGKLFGVSHQAVCHRTSPHFSRSELLESVTVDGLRFVKQKSGYFYNAETKERLHRHIWKKLVGEIPPGYHIHHRNNDRADNRINNLQCLSNSEHYAITKPGTATSPKKAAQCAINGRKGNGVPKRKRTYSIKSNTAK